MPAALFAMPAFWGAVGAGSAAAGAVYAANKSSSTQQAATRVEQTTVDKQLSYEKEQEAKRREDYEREQAEAKRQWDAEQARLDEQRTYERRTAEQDRQESMRRWEADQQRYADEIARQTKMDEASLAQRQAEFGFEKEKYNARQGVLAPYRAAGTAALSQLAQLAGVSGAPAPAAIEAPETMPANWQPGQPIVVSAAANAPGTRSSLLDNPNLMPAETSGAPMSATDLSRTPAPETVATASTGTEASSAPVSVNDAYRRLADTPSAAITSLTPAQIALLTRASAQKVPLSALVRRG